MFKTFYIAPFGGIVVDAIVLKYNITTEVRLLEILMLQVADKNLRFHLPVTRSACK